ncbi:MAG TPA: hypothetical protein ENK86_05585 [Campylobacterales bacterium]|nr:hypothetical protein [Campylobacterales bacterium]
MACDTVTPTNFYGYPKAEAARVAYQTVVDFLKQESDMEVRFVFFSVANEKAFREAVGCRVQF